MRDELTMLFRILLHTQPGKSNNLSVETLRYHYSEMVTQLPHVHQGRFLAIDLTTLPHMALVFASFRMALTAAMLLTAAESENIIVDYPVTKRTVQIGYSDRHFQAVWLYTVQPDRNPFC